MTEKMKEVPANEIIKVFNNYRIIKQYYRSGYDSSKIYDSLKLEVKRTNLAGEAYYSLAIDDPESRGDCVDAQRAYSLLNEFRSLQHDLLLALSK